MTNKCSPSDPFAKKARLLRLFCIGFGVGLSAGYWTNVSVAACPNAFDVHATSNNSPKKKEFLTDPNIFWRDWKNITRLPPYLGGPQLSYYFFPVMNDLPTGIAEKNRPHIQEIFLTLRDLSMSFDLISEVLAEMKQTGENIESLIARYEKVQGLGFTNLTHSLSKSEFNQLLRKRVIFNDVEGGNLRLDLGLMFEGKRLDTWQDNPYPDGLRHGVLTHRFQIHLMIRNYLKLSPDKPFADLIAALGSNKIEANLDWKATGVADLLHGPNGKERKNLFFWLFDSPENNFSNPAFLLLHQEKYWPELHLY